MTKSKLFVCLSCLVLAAFLVGCGNSVAGTWKGNMNGWAAVLALQSNGTGTLQLSSFVGSQSLDFTWKTEGNRLVFEPNNKEETAVNTFSGEYQLQGDTLTIHHQGSGTAIYTRS